MALSVVEGKLTNVPGLTRCTQVRLYVAFSSGASNLVGADTNATGDVFVVDCQSGQTTRVSVRSDGLQADAICVEAAISANGRCVAFDSGATNLVTGDNNAAWDVFVCDRGP